MNSKNGHPHDCFRTAALRLFIILALTLTILLSCTNSPSQETNLSPDSWQEEFFLADRRFNHTGQAKYFILKPGFQMTLASQNERLIITVLDETREIGKITTRIVEEREEKNGELYEISRNFYAFEQETGDVFYFGEEVDFYAKGEIIGHSGAWISYQDENKPGLIMPGNPLVGMKYYQEMAPGVAMDRAKVVSISETFTTVVGEFENCLLTQESSKLQPVAIEYKTYCPGIGLVQDQSMILIDYGYQSEN